MPRSTLSPSFSMVKARVSDKLLVVFLIICIVQTTRPKLAFLAYVIAAIGLIMERRLPAKVICASPQVVTLFLLVIISAVWSYAPTETVSRILPLLGTSGIALFAVCKLGRIELVATIADTMSVAAFLSVLVIVFLPGTGVQPDGVIRGIFAWKTALGPAMTIGLLSIACALPRARGFERTLLVLGFPTSTLLLFSCNDITGVATAMLLVLELPLLLYSRSKKSTRPALIAFAFACIITIAIQSNFADDVASIFGRDATLSGRTEIWGGSIAAISDSPILGYGYGAFWTNSGPWQRYVDSVWEPGAAHNGYLEELINFGFVGEAALLWFLASALARTIKAFSRRDDLTSVWALCVILNAIITNYTEATYLYPRLDWLVIVSAFFVGTFETLKDRSPKKRYSP